MTALMMAILFALGTRQHAFVCFNRLPIKFLQAPSIKPLPIARPAAKRSQYFNRFELLPKYLVESAEPLLFYPRRHCSNTHPVYNCNTFFKKQAFSSKYLATLTRDETEKITRRRPLANPTLSSTTRQSNQSGPCTLPTRTYHSMATLR